MSYRSILVFFTLLACGTGSAWAQSLCGTYTTGGSGQTFTGAVTLTCDTIVTDTGGGAIAFQATIDGGYSLTVSTNGAVTFGAAIGSTTAPNTLVVSADTVGLPSSVIVSKLALSTTGTIMQGAPWTVSGTTYVNAGTASIVLANVGNDFTGPVTLTGGNVSIADANALALGTLTTGNLTASSVGALVVGAGNGIINGIATLTTNGGSLTVDGNLNGLAGVTLDAASVAGTGSLTGTGAITGLGNTAVNLTGVQAGTVGSVGFSGFASADTTTVTGAASFDDGAKSSGNMTFANVSTVSGTGAITGVTGGFADDAGQSAATGIVYSGFSTVTGTGGAVTGVTGGFDVGTAVSAASGLDYSGFNLGSVAGSGAAATITGSGLSYTLDNTISNRGSHGSISWSGFGNIADASGSVHFGTAGSLTGDVTASTLDYSAHFGTVNFDLNDGAGSSSGIGGTWSSVSTVSGNAGASTITGSSTFALTGNQAGSAAGINFSAFTAADAATVSGAAGFDDTAKSSNGMTFANASHVSGTGAITGVTGGFADDAGQSAATGIVYSGFSAVTGTGGAVTGVTGDFDVGTAVSAASGLDYSGFNLGTVAGSGAAATITGSGLSYTLDNTISDRGSHGSIGWSGFGNIADASGSVHFGTAGSLSGDVTASTLDYSAYLTPVTVNLGGAGSTGVGGTVNGVSAVVADLALSVSGAAAPALSLTANAGAVAVGPLVVNGALAITADGTVTENGAVTANATSIQANGYAITFDAAGNAVAGILDVSGASAAIGNGQALNLGQIAVTGALTVTAPDISNGAGGSISFGNGTTTATINGNYTQSGSLTLHGSATGSDQLLVNGSATLGGQLALVFSAPPGVGQSMPLLQATSVNGQFAGVSGLATIPDGQVVYQPQQVLLARATAQTLTIGAPPTAHLDDSPITVTVTVPDGLPTTLVSTTPAICTVSGTASPFGVQLIGVGTCSLTAAQAGDATHLPVSQPVTIAIGGPAYVAVPAASRWALLLLAAMLVGGACLDRRRRG